MERRMDPKVDYVFKKLFASEEHKAILLNMLDAILRPPLEQRLVSLDLLNPFNEKDTWDDKISVVDVKARDQGGRLYNVEMQMSASVAYPHRALYYWAVLYDQQLREGMDYPALQPTISISILNDVLFAQVPDYHLDFQLRSTKYPGLIFSDQQTMHVLQLPNFHKNAEELTSPLEVWCYFLIHGAELDKNNLPAALRNAPVMRAVEVLNIMAQNDVEWERYQARLKSQRDYNMFVMDAREKGMKEGREEGRQEGRQEGRKEGIVELIHVCERLLKRPLTPREVLLALPLQELQARAQAIEQQLGVAGQ